MVRRREEGLCFNCLTKFTRDRLKECMCGIYLLDVEGETTVKEETLDDVHISSHAITGITSCMTMHLGIMIRPSRSAP